jgi:hypothetical protein
MNVANDPVASGAPAPDPAYSVDSRKNQMDGLTLRLAYGNTLSQSWSWQAGLQIARNKFRQEYIADVADTNWTTYEDTYNGVLYHSSTTVSPFVGLTFKVNEASSLGINLVGLRYVSADYVHVAGTGIANNNAYGAGNTTQDYATLTNRLVPHVEITYGIAPFPPDKLTV